MIAVAVGVIGLGTAALATGVINSYEALRADEVVVSPKGRLSSAFFALPWQGDDSAVAMPIADPTRAWLTRWTLVREAKQSIDVAYFILDGDIFGLSFLGALLAAAERGVRVRVLVDGLATDMADTVHTLTGENFLRVLAAHPNVEVRVVRPPIERVGRFLEDLQVGSLLASQHDKILNVDGKQVITGGRNIALSYFTLPEHAGHQFLDTDILLSSAPVVAHTHEAFERLYRSADVVEGDGMKLGRRETIRLAHDRMESWLNGQQLDFSTEPELEELERRWQQDLVQRPEYRGALGVRSQPTTFGARVRVVDSGTRDTPRADEITRTVLQFVAESTREITLVSPYLVLGESMTRALQEAADRGVRITVLTNSPLSSDNAISQALFLEQWPTLLARIPTLRLFVMGGVDTLHTKLMLFDRSVSLVGTYNLDPTAMRMNSELMIGLWSTRLNGHLRQQIDRRIVKGAPDVFRYRLKRAPDGNPERDEKGNLRIAFGPEDHLTDEQMESTRRYQKIIGSVRAALGLEPLVDAALDGGAVPARARPATAAPP